MTMLCLLQLQTSTKFFYQIRQSTLLQKVARKSLKGCYWEKTERHSKGGDINLPVGVTLPSLPMHTQWPIVLESLLPKGPLKETACPGIQLFVTNHQIPVPCEVFVPLSTPPLARTGVMKSLLTAPTLPALDHSIGWMCLAKEETHLFENIPLVFFSPVRTSFFKCRPKEWIITIDLPLVHW